MTSADARPAAELLARYASASFRQVWGKDMQKETVGLAQRITHAEEGLADVWDEGASFVYDMWLEVGLSDAPDLLDQNPYRAALCASRGDSNE